MTSAPDTRRLTVAQALMTYLSRQYSDLASHRWFG